MAQSWSSLQVQMKKIRMALEKPTPPEPDDEFEAIRSGLLAEHKKAEDYLSHKIEQTNG
jgi:hypothetical protein